MTEAELRKMYLEAIDRAYRCVNELSIINRSAQVLSYLNRPDIRKLFKDRDTGKLHAVLRHSTICHIVIRTVATCFDGGPKTLDMSPQEWKTLMQSKEHAFGYVVAFLSHSHDEALFVKRLAVRNHAFAKFAKNNQAELHALGLRGDPLPFTDEEERIALQDLNKAMDTWRALKNDHRHSKLLALRSANFAHNNLLPDEWFAINNLTVNELVDFVKVTWEAASSVLSLLLYGVISPNPCTANNDMDRLLLRGSTTSENID